MWWAAEIECLSALARLEREDLITPRNLGTAVDRLGRVQEQWEEIEPVNNVREIAKRLLRTHTLRAADALQLAAAVVAAEGRPSSLELLSLDRRLCVAAVREGFDVVDL